MKVLDLFCGAGGATRGYQRAGHHVTGVDLMPQPHYCGDAFYEADALVFLEGVLCEDGFPFDAIHASPPCQHYANVTLWRGSQEDHPALIEPTRDLLRQAGVPWVIENVRTKELCNPIVLCGSQFGLKVIRHRYFESNVELPLWGLACDHTGALAFEHKGERAYADAMGCEWMSSKEARQAIPPAYTEYLAPFLAAPEAAPNGVVAGVRWEQMSLL